MRYRLLPRARPECPDSPLARCATAPVVAPLRSLVRALVGDLLAVLPGRNVLNEREDEMTAYILAVCKPSHLSTNLSPNSR